MAKVKLLSLLTASLGLVSAYKPLNPIPSGRSPHHGKYTTATDPATVNVKVLQAYLSLILVLTTPSLLSTDTSTTGHYTSSTQAPDWLSFSYSQQSTSTPNS